MHDRTVDGEALIFGNQSALFMNAMTWWDHKTESVWSQPWGRAISGELSGTELRLLPSQLAPWGTWREEHPNSLVLAVDGSRLRPEGVHSGYVIGVPLGDVAMAFPYELAAEAGIVNDAVGPFPVVVHVDPEKHSVHVHVRQVDDRILTFVWREGVVQDLETESTWQMDRGLAIGGPLRGQALQRVPYIPAFPDAWRDFYPDSLWYAGE